MEGKLIGKAGSVFCSTGTQHGGQETTITTFHVTLCHLGFIIVPPGYTNTDILNMEVITGGSPYGVSTFAGADGKSRPVPEHDLKIARSQGHYVAQVAAKLAG